nr:DUF4247 domain-containing protein [Saccharopolyspora hordei]
MIIGLVTIFSTGTGPRGYVDKHFTRAAHLDLPGDSDNRAYTSPLAPSAVAFQISSKWRPQARYHDSTGIYLRYPDDAVVVQPHLRGSVVHVLDVDHAYRRYHSRLGGVWGWTSPHGESFRGRGPGAGK